MKPVILTLAFSLGIFGATGHVCAQNIESNGGDLYISGPSPEVNTNSARDLFVSGFSVSLDADVEQDAHLAGFNLDVSGSIGGDLYAVGSNIWINGSIQEDLTATGFLVDLDNEALVEGNSRISGATIKINSPIRGSLIAAGGTIELNALVGGDVRLFASEIIFGPAAEIDGELVYSTLNEMDVPTSVAGSNRVSFVPLSNSELISKFTRTISQSAHSVWMSFFGVLSAVLMSLLIILIIASIFLSSLPNSIVRMQKRVERNPWKMMLLGFLSLSLLFGLVPASVVILIGLPIVPVVILMILAAWLFGYILGVYSLAWHLFCRIRPLSDSTRTKLAVLTLGLVISTLINLIPIVGWLINLSIMLIGLGAITSLIANRWFRPGLFSDDSPLNEPASNQS